MSIALLFPYFYDLSTLQCPEIIKNTKTAGTITKYTKWLQAIGDQFESAVKVQKEPSEPWL